MGESSLAEAFEVLARGEVGPRAADAGALIRQRALGAARRDGRLGPADREDCAQEVFFKLFKRLACGDNPVSSRTSAACGAYIREMVRNWATDRASWAKRQREGRLRMAEPGSGAAPSAEDAAVRSEEARADAARHAHVRAVIDRVAAHAIESRTARHRAHLQRGWAELRALVFDEVPLRELLVRAGELGDDAHAETLRTVRNAAYKRHERTRLALEEATTSMREVGALEPADAELARLTIAGLARRQRSTPGGERS